MDDVENNYTLSDSINGPLLATVLAIEMVGALIINSIVLIITISQRKSWKLPSTIFFTSLIVANLVMNLLFTPFYFISAAAGEWIFGSTLEQKRGTCTFVAYFMWYCVLIISMTLAVISVDRFLFIVKPHIHKQYMRPWVAVTLITSIWLLAAIVNSTPFFGLGEFGFTTGSCLPSWNQIGYIAYNLVVFAVILSIITVTSIWTFCFTFKFIQTHSELTMQDNVYLNSREKRLVGIFGAMLLLYGLCFLPGFIDAAISLAIVLPEEVIHTALVLYLSFTIFNPLIQSYFRPDIARSLVSFYQKVKKCTASTIGVISEKIKSKDIPNMFCKRQ